MTNAIKLVWAGAVLLLWAGCATAPKVQEADPYSLLNLACEPGKDVKSVKGSVWLKAKSKDASGQFPAVVEASSDGKLKMEVTNLLGGTEAIITVDGRKYSIKSQNKKVRNEEGSGSWAGIPLEWAADLFLGKVPCPVEASRKDATVTVSEHGELLVETKSSLGRDPQRFAFKFKNWGGRNWPETLRWENLGAYKTQVDFKFDDPEDKTHSPRKWEAKSPQGEIKMRWKDRETQN